MGDSSDWQAKTERLEQRLRVLADASAAFAEATVDLDSLLETIARRVAQVLQDYCVVQFVSDDETTLTLAAVYSPEEEMLAQARRALSEPIVAATHPIFRYTLHTQESLMISQGQLEAMRQAAPSSTGAQFGAHIGVHSMLVVPLLANGRVLGVLTLARYRSDRPEFDEHDLDLAQGLARQASLAISNARLLADAHREIVERKRVEAQFRALAEASSDFTLATSDVDRLLAAVARRLSDLTGDLCVVRHVSADGQWVEGRGAVYHPSAELREVAASMVPATRQKLGQGHSGKAAEQRAPVLLNGLDPAAFADAAGYEHRALFDRFPVSGLMALPLMSRDQLVAVATMLRREGRAPFGADDVRLVQSVADYAGLSLSNARAYAAEREAREAAERATQALRASEARFAHLVDSGVIGVIVGYLDGRIVQVNDMLLKLIGHSREDIVSGAVPWRSLTPPEWAHVDRLAIEQLLTTGIGELREKEYLHRDGHRVPVMMGSAMISAETQECISFVLDLTERKEAQAVIASMKRAHEADAKFRSLLEGAPDAMVIADEANVITLVNARVEALFGYGRDELVGRSTGVLVAPQPGQPEGLLLGPGEFFGRRKNGTLFPMEVSVNPLRTSSGLLVSNAIRDVTERKRAERQRADLAAIVDTSDDAIIGTNRDNVITSWNHGAEVLFGYQASEVVGQPIEVIVPPDEGAAEVRLTLELGQPQRFDTVRRRKDGSTVHVSVTTSPVRNGRGQIVGVSKVARDITARIRTAEALTRAKDAAEAANRELEAFSYSVAHDLRTPLRGMSGFAQVLLEDHAASLDAEGQKYLGEIMQNAKRMGGLIDALLSLSRVSRSDLAPEDLDLSAMAEDVAASLRATEPDRAVEFVIAKGLHARLDGTLARSLLENLFSNAWKFSSKTPRARIEFGERDVDGEHSFFVKDNGAGFSMEYAQKLFVAFQRLHTRAEFPGTGIGLATVQRIVSRHGGRVWAEGTVGGGATFSFSVPRSRDASKAVSAARERRVGQPAS